MWQEISHAMEVQDMSIIFTSPYGFCSYSPAPLTQKELQ